MSNVFRNSISKPAGHWEASWKNAALELFCLREDICKSELCEMAGVSAPTMNAYLVEGKENKAFRELQKKLPKSLFK